MPPFTVLETSALFPNRMKYDYLAIHSPDEISGRGAG
jgi:hypothetical protein